MVRSCPAQPLPAFARVLLVADHEHIIEAVLLEEVRPIRTAPPSAAAPMSEEPACLPWLSFDKLRGRVPLPKKS